MGCHVRAETLNISAGPLASVPGVELENAFGALKFEQPIAILAPPGETNRLFVVERKGVIAVITNLANPTRTVFLDISNGTSNWYEELGLLGMAFHPGYATNGHFYIYWTPFDQFLRNQISRFTVSADDPNRADLQSHKIVLSQADANHHHNGGGLAFGPDGYLYCAIGFDSPRSDFASDNFQDIDKAFFAALLRIDVDKRPGNLPPNPSSIASDNYAIPADNPFVGATEFQGRTMDPAKVRTEIFAHGLRQPFKLAFDSVTGDLFLADVGENAIEEINLIKKGGNYGWPLKEGADWRGEARVDWEMESPLIEYAHGHAANNVGAAVMGGVVCRNGNIPGLEGAYLFGDFVTGNIWKYQRDGNGEAVTWIARELGIAAFGQHPADGSVLIANVADGIIRRLVYTPPDESKYPKKLSEAGFFTNLATLAPSQSFQPYEINVPFWSDNALKRRWFAMPPGSGVINFSADGNWQFPEEMVWVKHFDLEMTKGNPATARRVETRALVKTAEGVEGYTYRWNAAGTDAELVASDGADEVFKITDGAEARAQVWHFPARGECQSCHTPAAGYALGFNTWQLNKATARDGVSTNQLQWLAARGCLDWPSVEPEALRTLVAATDESQPIEHRVKSFFAANCISCHQPGAPAFRYKWDARITTPMSQSQIIGSTILKGDVENSNAYLRVEQFHPFYLHMPPLATELINPEAVALLSEYIGGLRTNNWTSLQLGTNTVLEGSIHRPAPERPIVGGSGTGFDDHFFYGLLLTNNAHLIARVETPTSLAPGFLAGLELRSGTNAGAPGAWLARMGSGENSFSFRDAESGAVQSKLSAGRDFPWLRLVRQEDRVTGYKSANGKTWQLAGRITLPMPAAMQAGAMVASGNSWRYATAEFGELQALSISLAVSNQSAVLPKIISFQAVIATNNAAVQRVDFFVGGALIGSSGALPWRFDWTNATSGSYDATAVAIDQNGLSVKSAPVRLNFSSRPSEAAFLGTAANDTGSWMNALGKIGYAIPGLGTNLPAHSTLWMAGATVAGDLAAPFVPGLETLDGGIVKSAWANAGALSFNLSLPTENAYRLTLYFAPYEHAVAQMVSLLGSAGTTLAAQVVQDAGRGFFVSTLARGAIQVRIESQNGFPATLSGIFVDPAPEATATVSAAPTSLVLPAPTQLQASVVAEGRAIQKVEFWDGGNLIGADSEAPYEWLWTNVTVGSHQLFARAIGSFGLDAVSAPVELQAVFPAAKASFLGADTATLGNWPEVYGEAGYAAPSLGTALPPQSVFAMNGTYYVWDASGTDPSALTNPDGSASLKAVNYALWAEGMQIDLQLPDGKPQQMALYLTDSATIKRSMTIRIFDALNGSLLVETPTGPVSDGVYFLFHIEGPIHIEIKPADAWEAVFGGLFLGGKMPPSQWWWLSKFKRLPTGDADWNEDPDGDGKPNLLEYALGSNPLAADAGLGQSLSLADDGATLVVRLPVAGSPADAVFHLETSTDLAEWATSSVEGVDAGDGNMEFRIPIAAGAQAYFRLSAETRDQQ